MNSEPIKLLLDENIWLGLTDALTERGFDVIHIISEDLRQIDHEAVMELAAKQGRAVLTYNVRDFAPLVAIWYETGKEHAGVILSTQLSQGELLRQVVRLLQTFSASDIKNGTLWLQDFKETSE
jgi:predicted nuclease of predicted toxin-antitoxin system